MCFLRSPLVFLCSTAKVSISTCTRFVLGLTSAFCDLQRRFVRSGLCLSFLTQARPSTLLDSAVRSPGRCSRGDGGEGWGGWGGGLEETEPRFLLVCFRKAASRSLRKRSLARRKAAELLTPPRTITAAVPDASLSLFFFAPSHPAPPLPPLPRSSGIHQGTRGGGEEAINC